MRRTAYLVIITTAALLLGSCTVTKNTTRKGSTPRTRYASASKGTGGSSASLGSAHKSNCSKLEVTASSTDNARLYSECASWLGAKYQYGGTTKSGVDCSGFVYMVYKAVFGKTLTRQSAGMLTDNCTRITKSQLREGDLVFFRTDGKKSSTPNHVGIYLKENKFIHASTSKGVVVSDLLQSYYVTNWITGGRVK